MFNSTSTPRLVETAIRAGDAYLWNGPLCGICGRGYVGSSSAHRCAEADLLARIAFLESMLAKVRAES